MQTKVCKQKFIYLLSYESGEGLEVITVNSFLIFRLSSQHLLVRALCREVYSASGNTVRTYSVGGEAYRMCR